MTDNLRTAASKLEHQADISLDIGREFRHAITNKHAALGLSPPIMSFDEAWESIDWSKWRSAPIRELVRHIHSLTDAASIPKPSSPLTRCAANRDGECVHSNCPQLRDKEPGASGRHCPLDTNEED